MNWCDLLLSCAPQAFPLLLPPLHQKYAPDQPPHSIGFSQLHARGEISCQRVSPIDFELLRLYQVRDCGEAMRASSGYLSLCVFCVCYKGEQIVRCVLFCTMWGLSREVDHYGLCLLSLWVGEMSCGALRLLSDS